MASSNSLLLEITIISAKHLHNVNWRNGPLKPYASVHLDPAHRLTTRPDDSLSTRPVWNESFSLRLTRPAQHSTLTLEVFHHSSIDNPATKPLVGTAMFPLSQLGDNLGESGLVKLDLFRPSGRPQGKILVKAGLRERPQMHDYQNAPAYPNYYYSAPPPSYHDRNYSESSPSPYGYADRYGPYSTYTPPQPLNNRPAAASVNYSAPSGPSAPPPATSSFSLSSESAPGGKGAPSAPVDYSLPPGTSASTGGEFVGSMGGLSLDDASGYEKERVPGHEATVPKADYREFKRWY